MSDLEEPSARTPREEAIPRLVALHGGRLHALARRFCRDEEEASDLVQETFLQAYRHWDRFEGRSRATTWLFTIAARLCTRFHRKRAGEPQHLRSLDEFLPLAADEMGVVPSDAAERAETRTAARTAVEDAIASLPATFRMPLVLKEVVGLSVREMAAVLGIREATAKTRLHRARLEVRNAVESVLPRRAVPGPRFSTRVCLDLLKAKQEALDRGVEFAFPDGEVCTRCAELFATLDLTSEVCSDVARGELPSALRRALADLDGGAGEDLRTRA